MAAKKYGKHIITDFKPLARHGVAERDPADVAKAMKSHLPLLNLDDEIIKGAFYVECVWIWPGKEFYPTKAEPRAHAHDYDEVITFFGSDFDNPHDLCGEIEIWLEDEQYMLTESCLIYVPKGMMHCPLVIHRVDRPIFHFATGTGGAYNQDE